jgi:hypothetical protein
MKIYPAYEDLKATFLRAIIMDELSELDEYQDEDPIAIYWDRPDVGLGGVMKHLGPSSARDYLGLLTGVVVCRDSGEVTTHRIRVECSGGMFRMILDGETSGTYLSGYFKDYL